MRLPTGRRMWSLETDEVDAPEGKAAMEDVETAGAASVTGQMTEPRAVSAIGAGPCGTGASRCVQSNARRICRGRIGRE